MSRGRSLRDISGTEGNLEVGGDVQPNASRLEAVYGRSLIINPYQGMYQEIHPCMVGSIDSVKIFPANDERILIMVMTFQFRLLASCSWLARRWISLFHFSKCLRKIWKCATELVRSSRPAESWLRRLLHHFKVNLLLKASNSYNRIVRPKTKNPASKIMHKKQGYLGNFGAKS